MPNGKLLIGPGLGPATVFDNNPAVQNFASILQDQKQKRDKEVADLQAELAKSSPVGIREPDRQGYMDKYSELQTLGRQKINERDPYKKAQLQAQIDKGFQDMGQYVSQSKQYGDQYNQFGQRLLDHNFRDQFSDDAIDQYMKSKQLPMNHESFIKDFNGLGRQVDAQKVLDRLDKHDKDLYVNTKDNTDINGKPINPLEQRITSGNKKGTIFTNQKVVNPADQAMRYGMEYDVNPQLRMALQQEMPDIFKNNDPKTAKALAIQQLVKSRPIQSHEKPGAPTWDEKPDRTLEHHIQEKEWDKANGFGNASQQPGYFENLTTEAIKGNPVAQEAYVNTFPATNFKDGQKPSFSADGKTLNVPDRIKPNTKAISDAAAAKVKYEASPEHTGWFGNGDVVPIEKSKKPAAQMYRENLAKAYTVTEKAHQIPLTGDMQKDRAALAEVAAKHGVAISAQDKVNKGQVPAPAKPASKQSYTIKGKTYKSKDVEEAAKASGRTVEEYIKELNGN